MYPVTSEFLTRIRYSHVAPTRCEVYSENLKLTELKVISGSVSVDSRRDVRRTCTITVVDETGELTPTTTFDILTPFGHELRLFRGVRLADESEEMVPLGVFVITNVTMKDSSDGLQIVVEGSDRSIKISRQKFIDNDFYIPNGTAKETAITNLLTDRWPDVQTQFFATGQTTTLLYPTLDSDRDPWRSAVRIAESAGLDLFFDVDGVAKLRSIPDPDVEVEVQTYEENEEAVLLNITRSLSVDDTFNGVIYTGEGSNLTLGVSGQAWDENPASATYRYGPFGEVPKFMSSPTILTAAEANTAAANELKKVLGATEKIDWTQIVNPAHDVYDLVKIIRPLSGIDARVVLDSLTIPLSPEQSMSAIARVRRF
jgi:hypothetical protein